jgi:ribosome-associated protein
MTAQEKVDIIVATADEIKAERIEVLNIREKSSVADFFVVCSGTSDRHVESIADRVEEALQKKQVKPVRTGGERTGWVYQDYGDVVFHVMREEQRQFYDLEALWSSIEKSPDLSASPDV